METEIDRNVLKKEVESHFGDIITTSGELLIDVIREIESDKMKKNVISESTLLENKKAVLDSYFGIWKDRDDLADSTNWVSIIRSSEWQR